MAAKKGKAGRKKKGRGKNRWPLLLALIIPIVAIAFYMVYQGNPSFSAAVDAKIDWLKGIASGESSGEQPETAPSVVASDRPIAVNERPTSERKPRVRPLPLPAEDVRDFPQPVIPRQEDKTASSATISLSVKQAQAVARKIFGGTVVASNTKPGGEWYELTLEGGKQRLPYAVAPVKVAVATSALTGEFVKGVKSMAVVLRVSDPSGPLWTSTFGGVTVLAGSATKPGRVLGASAMQAPRGRPTRFEGLDVQSDGTLEVVLELESDAPGGYLVRDLALHSFGAGTTKTLFSVRTLDDGPGVPLEEADFKTVGFSDFDQDGTLELVVAEGKRFYHIRGDLTRKLKREKTTGTRRFALKGGRFKLAEK
jgi:hypothetical protein